MFDIALKIFLFLSPLFFFKDYQVSAARGYFFITGTFALYCVSLACGQKRKMQDKWLAGFLFFALLRVFYGTDLGFKSSEWFNFWFSCAGFIYVFCAIVLFKTVYCYAENIKQYFAPIAAVCAVNFILVLAQMLNLDFMWRSAPSLCGLMETGSQLGQYSALALPVVYFINPAFSLIVLFTLVMSKSISSMLAFGIGAFLYALWKNKKKTALLILIIALAAGGLNAKRIRYKFSFRPVLWQKTLKAALERPYLGHGYGSFETKVMGYKENTQLFGPAESLKAHNDYLHTAQELGFAIVFCAGMFLLGLFRKLKFVPCDKILSVLAVSAVIVLINMAGQTLIRYASIAGTFVVLLALLSAKIEDMKNGQ